MCSWLDSWGTEMPGNDESALDVTGEVLADEQERVIEDLGRRAGAALRRPAPAEGPAEVMRRARTQRIVRAAGTAAAVVTVLIVGIIWINRGDSEVQPIHTVTDQTVPEPTVVTATTQPETTTTAGTTTSSVGEPEAAGAFVVTPGVTIENDLVSSLAYNADGSVLAATSPGFGLRLYDPDTLTVERELACPVTASPVAEGGSDFVWDPGVAAEWDDESRALITALNTAPLLRGDDSGCPIVFSADGSRAARSRGLPQSWRTTVWSTVDGTVIVEVPGTLPVFSGDGTRIATVDSGRALVWDVVTGSQVAEFDVGATGRPFSTVSQDGTQVLFAGVEHTFVTDPRTFAQVAEIPAGAGYGAAISNDGTRVAAANFATASVWDVVTGTELLRLEGGAGELLTVAFSPDGTLLATGGNGDGFRIFDATTGEELANLDPNPNANAENGLGGMVFFSPDGSSLAVNIYSGLQVWRYTRD